MPEYIDSNPETDIANTIELGRYLPNLGDITTHLKLKFDNL